MTPAAASNNIEINKNEITLTEKEIRLLPQATLYVRPLTEQQDCCHNEFLTLENNRHIKGGHGWQYLFSGIPVG